MPPTPFSRSRFLSTGAALAASGILPRAVAAQTPAEVPVTLAIDPNATGSPISPEFLGLSFPSATFAEQTFFNPDNPSVVALFRLLTPRGVLRIGGADVDRVTYAPASGSAAPAGITIAASDVNRLGAFAEKTGWNVIYGIDLASGAANDASREAAALNNALLGRLRAFSLGNAPDTYAARGLRPAGYAYPQYVSDFRASADAIRLRVPSAHFAGPDLASTEWLAPFARDERGVLLTGHWYAAAGASDPNATTARLLAPDPAYAAFLDTLRAAATANGESFRISELNTVPGGKAGVSDSFAAALWALDALFSAAAAGASGINVHAPPSGPSAVFVSDPAGTHAIRPLYYALLLFSRATAERIVPLGTAGNNALRAFALRSSAGATAVALINRDVAQDSRVTIDAGRPLSRVDVVRLRAPSLDSTTGVTLGGNAVGTDGTWSAGPAEHVAPIGTTAVVRVPFASAALVTLT